MKFSISKLIFFTIILISIFLRFYKLGEIPLSLDWDEVSNGYNAYSILKTTRDEYSNFLPLTNRSFDDYKPPLYMYLTLPSVGLFGLTPLAVRLPSAIFGVLTVVTVFYLSKIIFNNEKIALISMFFMAISPWHLQFSRVGFEANIGLFMSTASFTLLLYGVLKGDKNKNLLLILSALFLGLSFYAYHSLRIFIPLTFIIFILIFKKEVFRIPKKVILIFCLIVVTIVLPFFILTPKEAFIGRYQSTSQDLRVQDLDKSVKYISEDENKGLNLGKIIHNRRIVISQTFLQNYFSHFSFNYLFTNGDDNLRHHTNNMGMLYFFQLPFIISGIYFLIKNKTREYLFIIFWLILSPIPAAPTNAVPHAIRSYTMLIPFTLISSYSLFELFKLFKFNKLLISSILLIIILALSSYLHTYYIHYSKESASWWQYGYWETVESTEQIKGQYNKVIIDRSIEQAYAFWLFYSKFDPKTYQTQFSKNHFDKYYFDQQDINSDRTLLVSTSKNFPPGYKEVKTIYYPDGEAAIKIGEK